MNQITPELFELFRRNPMLFFLNLMVDGKDFQTVQWGKIMVERQRTDFTNVAPMLAWIAGGERPKQTKAWLQKSRGYSKTTDIAAMLAYMLVFAPKQLSIDIIADDEDQAKLVLTQLRKLISHNKWLEEYINAQRKRVVGTKTGTLAEFIARDPNSAYGRTPDVTIMDELTHWRTEDMWTAAFSSYAKKNGVLLVACNAGFGTGWQWNIRCLAERDEDWYFSAPHGPAPWRTEKELKEQELLLLKSEFRRLWWNEWQSSNGAYLSQDEAEACTDKDLIRRAEAPHDGLCYVACIDYAEKNDRTVCTLGHLENGTIVVDRMDVFDPQFMPDEICRVAVVIDWIERTHSNFAKERGKVIYLVDTWGLQTVVQEMGCRYPIIPIEFKSGLFNHRMGQVLRHLILHKRVRWYPGCGAIYMPDGEAYAPGGRREDLCTELGELITKTTSASKGVWRFDHLPGKHDDRAMSLGGLCAAIVDDTEGEIEWGFAPDEETSFTLN